MGMAEGEGEGISNLRASWYRLALKTGSSSSSAALYLRVDETGSTPVLMIVG